MKNYYLCFFVLFIFPLNAQINLDEEDVLIEKMCNYLLTNKEVVDSIRVNDASEKFLYAYLDKQDEKDLETTIDRIYFRYQKLCPEFFEILNKIEPITNEEGYYVDIPEKSIISRSDLKVFKNTKRFYYNFLNEITNVEITNGYWIETFPDSTYSKTKMEWLNETSFKLIFMESNNYMKGNYSRNGDEYFYEIIRKEANYYIIQTLVETDKYMQFKLYTID